MDNILQNRNFLNNQNYALGKLKKSDILAKYYAYKSDVLVMKIAYFLVYLLGMSFIALILICIGIVFIKFFLDSNKTIAFSTSFYLTIPLLFLLFIIDYFKKNIKKYAHFVGGYAILFGFFIITIILLYIIATAKQWILFSLLIIILILGLLFGVHNLLVLLLRSIIFVPAYIVFLLLSIFPLKKEKILYTRKLFTGEDINNFEYKKYIGLDKNVRQEMLLWIWGGAIVTIIVISTFLIFITLGIIDYLYYLYMIFILFILWKFDAFRNSPKSKVVKKIIRFVVNLNILDIMKFDSVKKVGSFDIIDKFLILKK